MKDKTINDFERLLTSISWMKVWMDGDGENVLLKQVVDTTKFSVTRFGEISPLWQYLKALDNFVFGNIILNLLWQFLCNWANFHFCKWPNIVLGHTPTSLHWDILMGHYLKFDSTLPQFATPLCQEPDVVNKFQSSVATPHWNNAMHSDESKEATWLALSNQCSHPVLF